MNPLIVPVIAESLTSALQSTTSLLAELSQQKTLRKELRARTKVAIRLIDEIGASNRTAVEQSAARVAQLVAWIGSIAQEDGMPVQERAMLITALNNSLIPLLDSFNTAVERSSRAWNSLGAAAAPHLRAA